MNFYEKNQIWEDPELSMSLLTYRQIIRGKMLSRYLLAKNFPVLFDKQDSLNKLFKLHEEKKKDFQDFVNKFQNKSIKNIRRFFLDSSAKGNYNRSYLSLKSTIIEHILTNCELCEHKCHVNRTKGELGICKLDDYAYLASAFVHLGEEKPIIPSGTIFFYGCNMNCVFCQNYDISQTYTQYELKSHRASPSFLKKIMESLYQENVFNINFVGGEPTPNLSSIIKAMLLININVPMLWNSNMYLSEKAMNIIVDLFDIWLPDFKYGDNNCAKKYSKVSNYWETVTRNIKLIEKEGSGEYIIRHLVMPNHTECCSKPILNWITDNLNNALVNIMDQYRPLFKALSSSYPEIQRKPFYEEIKEVREYADALGIKWKSVS